MAPSMPQLLLLWLLMVSLPFVLMEKQEEFELAEEAHKFAVQLAPNNSQPFRNYGALLQRQKRYEEAEKVR